MSLTDRSPNNSIPTLFKLLLTIFVLLFACIILEILAKLLHTLDVLTSYIVSFFLNSINLPEALSVFITINRPILSIILMMSIVSLSLSLIHNILDKIHIDPREKLINYITHKGWKIDFYRHIVLFKGICKSSFCLLSVGYYSDSRIISGIIFSGFQAYLLAYTGMLFFIAFFIRTSYLGEDFLGLNVLKSQNLLNYVDWEGFEFKMTIIVIIIASLSAALFVIWLFMFFIGMIPMKIIMYLFSNKAGVVDTSDVPISFIKVAIQELETVDFLESFDQIQNKKNKISNFINYSLECVKVDKEKTNLDYMNFCFLKCHGLLNKEAKDDIRFRLNGLSEMMNNTLIKINYMNCLEDKNEIMTDLEMYLKVMENKDLSKINTKEFITEGSTIDKALSFLLRNVLLPVTLVILTQMLI